MKNLIFIGPLQLGEIPHGGDTTKNRLFVDRFSKVFRKVYAVDTYKWKQRPLSAVKLLFYLFFVRKAKVIVSCETSAVKILDFLYRFRIQNDVYYWVVGNGFVGRIKNGIIPANHYSYLKAIYVQSPQMAETLHEFGLNNAIYVPNSKPVYDIPIVKHDYSQTKFVFVARILPEKGVENIFNCLKRLNAEGLSDKISMDFYGIVNTNYTTFQEHVNKTVNARYNGLLNLTTIDGYKTLSSYDIMLFPTYYNGEGFPGVFIDAFIAGLPVVTTDWHYNSEVIQDGKTGFIIPPKDDDRLYETIKWIINHREAIEPLRLNCKSESKKYDREIVLGLPNLKKIGLLE